MKFHLCLTIGLMIQNITLGQISNKIEKLIKPLESYEYFHVLDEQSPKILKKLKDQVNTTDLIFLSTNGKNPYIKVTALKALMQKDDHNLPRVFSNLLHSKDTVTLTTGSLTHQAHIAGYVYECITEIYSYSEKRKMEIKTELAKKILDQEPVNLGLIKYLFNQMPPDESYYTKIRDIAIQTQEKEFIFALAKYEKKNDIELIKSFGEQSFLAIGKFPDESFLPFLEEKLNMTNYEEISSILSNFCHEKALKLLQKLLSIIHEDKKLNEYQKKASIINLYDSVNRSDCNNYYDKVLENMWITHKILSFETLDNYIKNHTKNEAADFIISGLFIPGETTLLSKYHYDDYYSDEKKIVQLLKILKDLSQEKYLLGLAKVVDDIDDLLIYDFVVDLNDKNNLLKCKTNFINKMETNESAFGLLNIMKGIKHLKNKKLFKDCVEILKQRRSEFRNSSVWEKCLQDFMNENNLKF